MNLEASDVLEAPLAELLSDGLFTDGDWVESKDQDPRGEVRLIQLADIGDGVFRDRSARFLTMAKAKELGCTFLEAGDVLVARMPEPLGRACIFPGVGQPAVTAVDVCILRPNPHRVRPEWLVQMINSPQLRSSMQEFVRGTTRARISRKNLGKLFLRVPSPAAQTLVADAFDRLDTKRRNSLAHLDASRSAIARCRQTVLAAACSGRLTLDWRDEHPNQAAVVASAKLEGNGSAKTRRAVEDFRRPELPTLPETWTWVPLAAVASSVLGKMLDKAKNMGEPRPYLRNINVRWRGFGLSDVLEMRFQDGEEERYGLRPGDVLVCEGGEPGRAAVWREAASDMRFQKALHRVRCSDLLVPDWLVNVLQTHAWSGLLFTYFTGSGIAHLTGVSLTRVPVPLPPVEEQAEIIKRVNKLFALADGLERRLEAAARRIDRSSQAVLAKAFRGELLSTASSGLTPE